MRSHSPPSAAQLQTSKCVAHGAQLPSPMCLLFSIREKKKIEMSVHLQCALRKLKINEISTHNKCTISAFTLSPFHFFFFILFIYSRNYIKSAAHEYVHRHHHCRSGFFVLPFPFSIPAFVRHAKKHRKMQNPLPESVGRCSNGTSSTARKKLHSKKAQRI